MSPQALFFGITYGMTLLPKPTQNNTLTLSGSYLSRASGFTWPSTIDRSSQQLRWTAAVGEQRSVLSLAISSIYLQINVTLLKWPLKHCHLPTLTTCLLVPLSRHVVATLWFFFFQTKPLRWDTGLDHWCQREGLMVCVLCTVYKSISDGSVWIFATFNLIKWKHGEKINRSPDKSLFADFSLMFVHAHTHAHGLESFSRTEHWKPPKREGIKYSPLWGDRKKESNTEKKIWFMKVWLFSILECQCHGNILNGQVEGGSWMRGPLNS